MHGTFRNFRFLAAAWAAPLFAALPVQAQAEANLQVLTLNSYDEGTAPYARVRSAFRTELQSNSLSPIAFWQFDLQERGAEEANQALKAELLQSQYAEAPANLIVALGPPAVAFWLAHADAIPAGPLFIAVGGRDALAQMELRPGDAVVATPASFVDLVEGILRLRPETSHVVIVFGASDHERRLASAARKELEGAFDGLEFEFTNDLGLRELQDRLAGLDEGSAVLYGLFDSDVNGILMQGHAGLQYVRAASKVPELNGVEALEELKKFNPGVRVVFLTMHHNVAYARQAMDAGALGYVIKHSAAEELILAVRAAAAGRTYVTPAIAGELLQAMRAGDSPNIDPVRKLTPRQREILRLLVDGHSAKAIAARLDISPRTVEFHKYAMMEALGAANSAELIRLALKSDIHET
jgi:DNA-binding NarL/FixJ family response regulator